MSMLLPSLSFSFSRLYGVMVKEFIQMKRDRMTFGMIVGIPVIQLIMFGFAINADPKNLPIAVVSADNSVYSRSFIRALENTKYFTVVSIADTETAANR
ncbi:MAG: ABC transporter permease, partial [Betaproteobacteria bacterium]